MEAGVRRAAESSRGGGGTADRLEGQLTQRRQAAKTQRAGRCGGEDRLEFTHLAAEGATQPKSLRLGTLAPLRWFNCVSRVRLVSLATFNIQPVTWNGHVSR
jgi:hypothetical protein